MKLEEELSVRLFERLGLGISIVPEMALEKRSDCCSVLIADERASRTIGVAALKLK
jgi:hypothetical protein